MLFFCSAEDTVQRRDEWLPKRRPETDKRLLCRIYKIIYLQIKNEKKKEETQKCVNKMNRQFRKGRVWVLKIIWRDTQCMCNQRNAKLTTLFFHFIPLGFSRFKKPNKSKCWLRMGGNRNQTHSGGVGINWGLCFDSSLVVPSENYWLTYPRTWINTKMQWHRR